MTKDKTVTMSRELAKRVMELFDYDQESGNFIRKFKTNCKGCDVGTVAGCLKKDGQIWICVDGARYTAHRLAWLYMTGDWPKNMVDHKDLDNTNNAWSNLRECNNGENKMNTGAQANNKLGIKNVMQIRNGSFKASVGKDKRYYQKIFKTVEEATLWAEAKRKELHGEFARGAR